MSAKIVFAILNETADKWEAAKAFDTFDVFYGRALEFKQRNDRAILRVHIPSDFALSAEEIAKIDALGITRI